MKRNALIGVCFLAFLLAITPAFAACTSPTGSEAQIIYSSDYHTYQFCNGTNWMAAGTISLTSSANIFGDTGVEGGTDGGDLGDILTQLETLSIAGTLQSLSIYVTTAAGHITLGIYDTTGSSGNAGALLAKTASFVPTTGWNTVNVVTPVSLAAGNYWLAWATDSNTTAVASGGTQTQYSYAHAYGMPTPMSGTLTTWVNAHDSLYATTKAGVCTSPAGTESQTQYNTDYHTLQYCNGVNWVPLGSGSGGGGGGCSSPSGTEGQTVYNTDYHTYQYCNGTNWVKFTGAASVAMPGASDGYFVMSKTTWNGNLTGGSGNRSDADALCVTEITTNTGWRGYADANARGILNSTHVHAFLCNWPDCNNLNPNTTYFFADANNAAHGGASFTTDSSGAGPGYQTDWTQASYFGSNYKYWMGGRNSGYGSDANHWGTTLWSSGASCGMWDHSTSGYGDCIGQAGMLGVSGVYTAEYGGYDYCGYNSQVTCNNTQNVICYVNP